MSKSRFFTVLAVAVGATCSGFIMDLENLSFPEAVVKVADFGHIDLPASYTAQSQPAAPKDQQQADLLKLYADSAKMYQHILVNTELGEPALKYLHERGLDDETIKTFGIGYAPANQLLLDFLKNTRPTTNYYGSRDCSLKIKRVTYVIAPLTGSCFRLKTRVVG
ncbi:hypothetical protein T1I15_12545 [Lactiplantibacillus plantarum]|nr:hypothetical protein T1I15_12545 [Lactiplantibacillus plantarum]